MNICKQHHSSIKLYITVHTKISLSYLNNDQIDSPQNLQQYKINLSILLMKIKFCRNIRFQLRLMIFSINAIMRYKNLQMHSFNKHKLGVVLCQKTKMGWILWKMTALHTVTQARGLPSGVKEMSEMTRISFEHFSNRPKKS